MNFLRLDSSQLKKIKWRGDSNTICVLETRILGVFRAERLYCVCFCVTWYLHMTTSAVFPGDWLVCSRWVRHAWGVVGYLCCGQWNVDGSDWSWVVDAWVTALFSTLADVGRFLHLFFPSFGDRVSLYSCNWPQTQWSFCLFLSSARVKGMHHHAWLLFQFYLLKTS